MPDSASSPSSRRSASERLSLTCTPYKATIDDKEFTGEDLPLRRYTLVDGPKLKWEVLGSNSRPNFFTVQRNDDNTLVASYREVYGATTINYLVTISKREKTVREHSRTKQGHGYPDSDDIIFLRCH
jgi:hypothetical protein